MLEIKNVTLSTRFSILENANYTFEEGIIYGIIATNGSGKTTLFRSINNLIPIQSGNISIDSQSINQKRKDIFYFETSDWFDLNLTGNDYLQLIKKEYNSDKSIQECIEIFSMESYVNIPIKKYSLGMKQKLLISLYFISNASYLIMDEITNGLDDLSRQIFMKLINHLQNSSKPKTILISSHYKEDLNQFCDKFVAIQDKKLVGV